MSLFPANTVDGKVVQIVKKEYRANEGVFLTDEDGNEYVAVRNGQVIAPVGSEAAQLRPTQEPAASEEIEVLVELEDPADPDAAEAQV